jgi:hypothetical protein
MADRRAAPDAVLDLLVFAPLGLAVRLADELPELARLGRATTERQVASARVVGQLAVAYARQQVRSRLGPSTPRAPASSESPKGSAARARVLPEGAAVATNSSTVEAAPGPAKAPADARPPADALAIPGYDALAASQVVARLASLEPAELEAIEAYEAATRGRRTILNRIAQLRAEHERAR